MNKKLFGTLLLGSLLLGGTFVSCKDYDDDIENLQEQINNLATKSDVETKLGQLQSALTAAQQKAEEALAAAKAADNSAEVKALSEKLDKIADAQAAVNEALEATKNEISEQLAEFDEATKQMIAEAQKKAEETVGKVADYVTAVKVLPTTDLTFESSQILKANEKEFGKADTYAKDKAQSAISTYAYKAGAYVKSPTSLILRVDPSNAQLTANDIKLLDSKGNDLSGVVEVDNVFPYDQLLSRGGNGLWQVNLKAADGVTSGKLGTATTAFVNNNFEQKLYAVAVNNTMSTAEERYVMSDYEVTFAKTNGITAYAGETSLDGVKISTTQNEGIFDTNNALFDQNNAAVAKIYAANGEKITVAFPANSKADRFYVVRADDKANTTGGNNSANAWKRYSYTGLGEIKSITDGEKLEMSITIDEDLAVGDDICFRLYAVNRDGTYVLDNAGHKHGQIFWVHVGKNQNNASAITANIAAQSATEFSTGWVEYNGTLVDGTALPGTTTLKVGNVPFNVNVEYAKSFNADGTPNGPAKNSETKYVKITLPAYATAQNIKDNATLVGTIETTNGGVKENVIEVSLTKTLPTVEQTKKLMNYSWKAGQLVNGVYTAYLYPTGNVWTTKAASGYKTMTQAINGLAAPAFIAIENAALKTDPATGKKYYNGTKTINTGVYKLTVNNSPDYANVKLIDNTTQHKTVIGYNYGQISTETVDENGVITDYKVVVEEYQTVFACPLDVTVQTLAWKKYEAAATQTLPAVSKDLNVITYHKAWSSKAQDGTTNLKLADYLIATNAFDNVVFGGKFSTVYAKYVQVDAELVSNETGNEDYFTVTYDPANGDFQFTAKSGTTNPAVDVPSTLKITLTDCFGHKNEYSLPFTVKRAQ